MALAAIMVISLAVTVQAAKTYQVTGPVLEVNEKMIVVDKNGERWEVDREAAKLTGKDPKVGDKVMVQYTMTAKEIENKEPAKAPAATKAAATKAAATKAAATKAAVKAPAMGAPAR